MPPKNGKSIGEQTVHNCKRNVTNMTKNITQEIIAEMQRVAEKMNEDLEDMEQFHDYDPSAAFSQAWEDLEEMVEKMKALSTLLYEAKKIQWGHE